MCDSQKFFYRKYDIFETYILALQQLQDREQELNELQEELAGGAAALEELSAQLEEERMRSTPSVVNTAQQKVCMVTHTHTHTHTVTHTHTLDISLSLSLSGFGSS